MNNKQLTDIISAYFFGLITGIYTDNVILPSACFICFLLLLKNKNDAGKN